MTGAPRRPPANEPRPTHPTVPAIVFVIVVTVTIVGLALVSTAGR